MFWEGHLKGINKKVHGLKLSRRREIQTAIIMICLAGLVSFLLFVTAEAQVGLTDENSLCKDTEQCLIYNTVCKGKNFEIRHYKPVKWACASTNATNWLSGVVPIFWSVFRYLSNEMKVGPGTLEISAPFNPTSLLGLTKRQYTLCFPLPMEHQNNPPDPTNQVEIVAAGDSYVYVRSYRGIMTDATEQAELLSQSINKTVKNFRHVGYNKPSFDEYLEVWARADDTAQCN